VLQKTGSLRYFGLSSSVQAGSFENLQEALQFHCTLILLINFILGRKPLVQLPWQQNIMRHGTFICDVKRAVERLVEK